MLQCHATIKLQVASSSVPSLHVQILLLGGPTLVAMRVENLVVGVCVRNGAHGLRSLECATHQKFLSGPSNSYLL